MTDGHAPFVAMAYQADDPTTERGMTHMSDIVTTSGIAYIADVSPHYSRWDWEDAADVKGWKSVASIDGPDGSPVSSGGYAESGYNSAQDMILSESNANAVRAILTAVDATRAGWEEGAARTFVYDPDNAVVLEAVEGIERSLNDYPLLDETDHSEREHAYMVESIDRSGVSLPDDLDAESVLSRMRSEDVDVYPGAIDDDMIRSAIESEGYTACSGCGDGAWLTPANARTGEPLCRECALIEAGDLTDDPDVAASALAPYLVNYATEQGCAYREDIRRIMGAADDTHALMYPYGK